MRHSSCLLGTHASAVAKAGKFLFLFKRCGHVALINPQGDLIVNPSEESLSCMLPSLHTASPRQLKSNCTLCSSPPPACPFPPSLSASRLPGAERAALVVPRLGVPAPAAELQQEPGGHPAGPARGQEHQVGLQMWWRRRGG